MITVSEYLKQRYGQKIYRLALSSGCSCPNRDGTIGTGGCTFCSEGGSGDFAAPFLPVDEQIRLARQRVDAKIPASIPPDQRKYIAYFQSYTNTWGDEKRLRELYTETVSRPEIVILSLGTRPDCLPPEMLAMIRDLNRIKPVWIELGLQTIHEKTSRRIHRGYDLPVFEEAYRNLTAMGISVIVHVILGLPGETREDMLDTVRYLSQLDPPLSGIKLQLLHILQGTEMAREYSAAPEDFLKMSMEEYTDLVAACLSILPETTVIHRMTGDGPKKLLIAPAWSADKKRVLNMLHAKIRVMG